MSSIVDHCADLDAGRKLLAATMTRKDREVAAGWLAEHYRGNFPLEFFPETGITVVDLSGRALLVVPLYFESTTPVAVAGHMVFAPGNPPRLNARAVRVALAGCRDYAASRGRRYLLTLYGRKSINRIADRMGFARADQVEEKFLFLG